MQDTNTSQQHSLEKVNTSGHSCGDVGDPVALAVEYERQGADELVMLDISATPEQRKTAVHIVRDLVSVFIRIGIPVLGLVFRIGFFCCVKLAPLLFTRRL